MLYDNKPLESIPVTAVQWESAWNPQQVFKFDSRYCGNVIQEFLLFNQDYA